MGALEEGAREAAKQAAILAKAEIEKRTKEFDEAAVKLCIRAVCCSGLASYCPPLRVLVNGRALPRLLNDVKSGEKNQLITWCRVKVTLKGPDPIIVALEPVGPSGRFFRVGKSKKRCYEPAYRRNAIELHGGVFEVPPKTDDFDAHPVDIVVLVRGGGLFGMFDPPDIIEQWRLKENSTT
jgi:hypothetical protein